MKNLSINKLLKNTLVLGPTVLGLATQSALADQTWIGGTDTNWNTAANWSTGVPNAETVFINNISAGTTYAPTIFTTPATQSTHIFVGNGGGAGALNIVSGGNLTANYSGGWWNNGALALGQDDGSAGTLNMSGGTLGVTGDVWVGAWGGTGNWNQTGGTANISGVWSVGNYKDVQVNSTIGNATVANGAVNAGSVSIGTGRDSGNNNIQGSVNVNSGGIVSSEGDLNVGFAGNNTVKGTMNINNGGVVNVGSTIQRWVIIAHWDAESGEMNVNSGGTLNLKAGTDLQVGYASSGTAHLTVGGTINGSAADGVGGDASYVALNTSVSIVNILAGGVINADVRAHAGIIGGAGTINGNLTLDSGALFAFSANDTLTVSGTLTLDPSFGVASLYGLDSSVADGTYTLINTTGDFSGIQNFGAANAYDLGGSKEAYFQNGSLELVVTTVPEPQTWVLMGGGLTSLFLLRKRKLSI